MDIVDDEFWLKYAKDEITNSNASLTDSAARLEKMTIWFWGLYTTSYTIGVTTNIIDAPPGVLILLASPIGLLIITYWLCVRAQLPVNGTYDPRIPSEILHAYNTGRAERHKRFQSALNSTFIAGVFLIMALTSLAFYPRKNNIHVNAVLEQRTVVIDGILPKKSLVVIKLDSIGATNSADDLGANVLFFKHYFQADEQGMINVNISLDSIRGFNHIPSKIFVTTGWREENIEKYFIQTLSKDK